MTTYYSDYAEPPQPDSYYYPDPATLYPGPESLAGSAYPSAPAPAPASAARRLTFQPPAEWAHPQGPPPTGSRTNSPSASRRGRRTRTPPAGARPGAAGPPAAVCQGWLSKYTVGKSSLLPHKELPRWFVADAGGLSYHTKEPAGGGHPDAPKPKARLPWASITDVQSTLADELRPPRLDPSKAYFAVQHAADGGRPQWVVLGAETREERVMWLDTIRDFLHPRNPARSSLARSKGISAAAGAPPPPPPDFRLRQPRGWAPPPPAATAPAAYSEEVDTPYFSGYSRLCIHEEMLRDDVRTGAYYNAILGNRALFEGKVVVDVGCGTGVLSIFSAWAGARKVFAIEASDMAHHARNIVRDNGLGHVVTVVHGRAEDCELLDDDGSPVMADVIVSEWMGYFLVYESMYESVFYARDRWLKPEGVMFPSHATLFLCPFTHDKYFNDRVFFWQDVYGVNMASLTEYAKSSAFDSVVVEPIETANCLGMGSVVKFFDCRTASVAEVQHFRSSFSFTFTHPGTFHGFAGYFTVYFAPTALLNDPAEVDTSTAWVLSTSPFEPTTHWRQSLFFTGDRIAVTPGQTIEGEIEVTQNVDNRRYLDVAVHWSHGRAGARLPGEASNPPTAAAFAHSKRFGFS